MIRIVTKLICQKTNYLYFVAPFTVCPIIGLERIPIQNFP